MPEAQEKILAFDNQFFEFGTQEVEGVACVVTPFPVIDPDENTLTLKLTQGQLLELTSSIQIGAEWAYPDKSHQILFNFLKGLLCAPEMTAEAACTKYSPTSSFVHYYPNTPDSTTIPDGYILPAWYRFGAFDSIFPDWINDWINNAIEDFTGYLSTDILCNIASFPINTIEAFLSNGGILPSFEVHVTGQGTIKLELLSFPLGGRACIKLDSPPNLIDLLTGGILDPNTLYVDTVRDIFSFPPEEAVTNTVSIEVETAGAHVLYVVFVPLIDDSLSFLGLGGGIRSLELCGFEEVAEVGIESIVWDGCELKYVSGGVETSIVTASAIQDCMDFSGIGGGSGGTAIVRTETIDIPSLVSNNTNTYAAVVTLSHTPTLPNMLVIVGGILLGGTAAGSISDMRVIFNGLAGDDATVATVKASVEQIATVSDVFSGLTVGVAHDIVVQIKQRTAATSARAYTAETASITIIEFDESAGGLYVEDIEVLSNGDIRKKIGGVWITVTESLAGKLAAIESVANAAQITANNALTIANGAVTVNTTQTANINAINDALDVIAGDIVNLTAITDDHEARITALEAIDPPEAVYWTHEFDFMVDDHNWYEVISADWEIGRGWKHVGAGEMLIGKSTAINDQRVTHMKLFFRVNGGAYPSEMLAAYGDVEFGLGSIRYGAINTVVSGWIKVPNNDSSPDAMITLQHISGTPAFDLQKVILMGKGDDPF